MHSSRKSTITLVSTRSKFKQSGSAWMQSWTENWTVSLTCPSISLSRELVECRATLYNSSRISPKSITPKIQTCQRMKLTSNKLSRPIYFGQFWKSSMRKSVSNSCATFMPAKDFPRIRLVLPLSTVCTHQRNRRTTIMEVLRRLLATGLTVCLSLTLAHSSLTHLTIRAL